MQSFDNGASRTLTDILQTETWKRLRLAPHGGSSAGAKASYVLLYGRSIGVRFEIDRTTAQRNVAPVGVERCGDPRFAESHHQTPCFLDTSLTISARRRKPLAHHTSLFGKQPRIAAMKTLLISAASLVFISGTALAREVILTPSVPFHGASAPAEHRAARLESPVREGAVFCSAMYVTTTRGDGSSATRKSVNCDE